MWLDVRLKLRSAKAHGKSGFTAYTYLDPRDNGKENGSYHNGLYRISGFRVWQILT